MTINIKIKAADLDEKHRYGPLSYLIYLITNAAAERINSVISEPETVKLEE